MKKAILSLCLLCFAAPVSVFADHHGPMKEPSKEERAQMVEMYGKLAECLKTEKSSADCHKEVHEACPLAKAGKCPMNHHHGPDGHGGPKKHKDKKGA